MPRGRRKMWIVEDRQESRRIRHGHLIKERLVSIEQSDKVDIPFEIGRFVADLLQGSPHLDIFCVDSGWQESDQPQLLTFGKSEGSGFVLSRIVEEFYANIRVEWLGRSHPV
jgi:hypothetical protein